MVILLNPYFWFFALWSAMITPVTFHVEWYIGKKVRWKVQLRAAGVPLLQRQTRDHAPGRKKAAHVRVAEALAAGEGRTAAALIRTGALGRFLKSFRLDRLTLHLSLSPADAAMTAVLYALIRNVLQTLALCGVMPKRTDGRVEMDFHSLGTQFHLQGIISCRLGTLGLAAGRLFWAARCEREKWMTAEEEGHAAASH